MTEPIEPQEINRVLGLDDADTDLEAYVGYQLVRAFRNRLLYGNPHGPVHGPTPRGILSEPPEEP